VDAYNQFLTENNLVSQIHTIISSELSSAEKSKQIQDLIYAAPIPENLEEKFLQEFRNLNADAVAVRSSSTAEDMDTASFAGQMETTLNVQGEEAFLTAVKRSWASLWTQRAIEYRKDYDIPLEVGQAVFVQTMIDSQVSGVISTMNVLSNDWSEMVVNSGWGLGSGPIEGKTNSDQFILDMKTGRLKEELIARKTTEYTKESGNNPVSVSPNRVFAKTLTPDKLSTLHRYAKVLEDYYGFPLDIEFAIDRIGMIHIVQVRPITTVDIRNDIHLGDLSFLHRRQSLA
jgi:pyruvate,water dikinase